MTIRMGHLGTVGDFLMYFFPFQLGRDVRKHTKFKNLKL